MRESELLAVLAALICGFIVARILMFIVLDKLSRIRKRKDGF